MLNLLEKIVEVVVDMEYVIHIMDNAHVILAGKEVHVHKKKLSHVQEIVEEVQWELVNLMHLANVILAIC